MNKKINNINVFAYDDYRLFLADCDEAKKQEMGRKFSQRYICKKLGFSSSRFFHRVIQGERNLTLESIRKVSELFSIKGRPFEYFENLVMFNQAKTEDDRIKFFDKLKEYKEYIQLRLLRKDQSTYMLKWYYPVVREMTRWPEFQLRPNWIASKVKPSILVSQAKEAIDVLLKLELISVDEKGKWSPSYPKVGTTDQDVGHEVKSYYDKAILLGRESLKLPATDRNISATTLSMSPATFELLRKKIEVFHKEIAGIISQPITKKKLRENNVSEDLIKQEEFFDVTEVGQLNVQFFKVAKLRR